MSSTIRGRRLDSTTSAPANHSTSPVRAKRRSSHRSAAGVSGRSRQRESVFWSSKSGVGKRGSTRKSFRWRAHLDRAWVPDDPGRPFHRRDYGWRRVIGAESPRRLLHARQPEAGLPSASKNSSSIGRGRAFVKPPTPPKLASVEGQLVSEGSDRAAYGRSPVPRHSGAPSFCAGCQCTSVVDSGLTRDRRSCVGETRVPSETPLSIQRYGTPGAPSLWSSIQPGLSGGARDCRH